MAGDRYDRALEALSECETHEQAEIAMARFGFWLLVTPAGRFPMEPIDGWVLAGVAGGDA